MITSLDHIGTAVADLAEARTTFARLGFQLTTISHHSGATVPGGPVEPWGSANHCAMLRRGYLELLGIVDRELYNPVELMLKRYAGPHIVAFAAANADATYADLRTRTASVSPPRALERMAPYGRDGSQERRAAFRLVGLDREQFPEARMQFTEHLTREVLWQPWLVEHPNGVVALTEARLVVGDPPATAQKLAHVFGVASEQNAGDGARVTLAGSSLVFHTRPGWERLTEVALDKPEPAVVGIGLEVGSLAHTRDYLEKAGVATAMRDGRLHVPARAACGAELIFHE
jgi:catechol 2,3-dioxygenase-like lactoylglutathione lyase family enzyme